MIFNCSIIFSDAIGAEDIYDGNLKLILGLVWTLICHYQLRSTGKGVPVKTAMLMCIGAEIHEYKVTNFNKDWNDGRALCGLVEGIKPGLCPNHKQLDPKNGLNNCRLGMDLAEMHFGVPQILAPEDLNNPAIDELSVMTYLSYFMSGISSQTLQWVQQVLPERNITNLTSDWISGVTFGILLERLFEICPESAGMVESEKASNMEKILSLVKSCLDCTLPHSVKVLTDPEIDELSMCSVLAQLRIARLKGGAGVFTLQLSGGSLEMGEAVMPTVGLSEEVTPELLKQFVLFGQIGGKGERVTFQLLGQSAAQLQFSAVPPRPGPFHVFAQYRGINVQGSPAVVLVNPPINERVSPVELPDHPTVNIREQFSFRIKSEVPLKPHDLSVEAKGTAPDSDCTGEVVAIDDITFEATFTPMKGGKYKVIVKLGEKSIRGVPFNVQAIFPAKLVSIGDIPKNAIIVMEEPFVFPITSMVELDEGDLGVTVKGPKKELTGEVSKISGTSFTGCFTPHSAGVHKVEVCLGGTPITGSPFEIDVTDPALKAFVQDLPKDSTVLVKQPFSFTVKAGMEVNPSDLSVLGTDSKGKKVMGEIVNEEGVVGACSVCLTLDSIGKYTVSVTHKNSEIVGAPFEVEAIDPSLCGIIGELPTVIHAGESVSFTLRLGEGNSGHSLKVWEESMGQASVVSVDTKQNMDGTYTITLASTGIGSSLVHVTLAGETIAQCPFKVHTVDVDRVFIDDDELDFLSQGIVVDEPISFKIHTQGAGNIKPEVYFTNPSGQDRYARLTEVKDSIFRVDAQEFSEEGYYKMHIKYGKKTVSKSPWTMTVNPRQQVHCHVTGKGIKTAIAGQPSKFKIFSTEENALEQGMLNVEIMSAAGGYKATVNIVDNHDKSYTVTYTCQRAGNYLVKVNFFGKPAPGSPFRVDVLEGALSSRCRAYGATLDPDTVIMSGTPQEFYVDTTEAGNGHLVVVIRGHKEDPKVFITDNKDGIYTVKFEVLGHGRYYANVWWGDKHISGSPFPLNVHRHANPGLVKVTGAGVQSSLNIKVPAEIFIDTTDAGVGTLNIRVRGIKDTFNVSAKPVSDTDTRKLVATYSPTEAGQYNISIKLQSSHVPGSPFIVEVFDPDDDDIMVGDEDSDAEPNSYSSSNGESDEEKHERYVSAKRRSQKSPRRPKTHPRARRQRQVLDSEVFIGESATVSPGWTATPVSYQKTPMWHYPKTQSTPVIKKDPISDRHKLKMAAQVQEQKRQGLWTGKY